MWFDYSVYKLQSKSMSKLHKKKILLPLTSYRKNLTKFTTQTLLSQEQRKFTDTQQLISKLLHKVPIYPTQ